MIGNRDARACRWGGISIELGSIRRSVSSIESAGEQFKAHKLPMNAELLNYGYFHESNITPEDCISRVVSGTLTSTGLDAERVDMLIIASADVGFLTAERDFVPSLLYHVGLTRALPLVVTAQECTGLLSALDIAWRYVRQGRFRNILVVSYDRATSESQRIQSFGVLSDAAVACLVTAEQLLDFSFRGFSMRSDLRGMRGSDDFASRKSLIADVTADVLGPEAIALADISKVFATNFFKPIAAFNASSLSLGECQLYTGRTSEIGHCLCADPLINLAEFLGGTTTGGGGEFHLLQAYAPGFLAAMLIEHVAVTTPMLDEAVGTEVQSW